MNPPSGTTIQPVVPNGAYLPVRRPDRWARRRALLAGFAIGVGTGLLVGAALWLGP